MTKTRGADKPRKQGPSLGPWSYEKNPKLSGAKYWIMVRNAWNTTSKSSIASCGDEANAALIATAPETYAELKEIAGHIVNASKRHEPLDSEWLLKRAKTALETCSKAETV